MEGGLAPVPAPRSTQAAGGVTARRDGGGGRGRPGVFDRDLRGRQDDEEAATAADETPAILHPNPRPTLAATRSPLRRGDDGLMHLDVTV